MDVYLFLKALAAFVFVMSLMVGMHWVLKRSGLASPMGTGGKAKRLKVVETLALDTRRRLVLVRRDNQEHLIVLGQGRETVVETNIPARDDVMQPETIVDMPNQKEQRHAGL